MTVGRGNCVATVVHLKIPLLLCFCTTRAPYCCFLPTLGLLASVVLVPVVPLELLLLLRYVLLVLEADQCMYPQVKVIEVSWGQAGFLIFPVPPLGLLPLPFCSPSYLQLAVSVVNGGDVGGAPVESCR